MDSAPCDRVPAKIVIAGPFGVGKTTLVGALSEIPPLTTEEILTAAGTVVDDLTGIADKTTTTTAIDFGRLTLPGVTLYLFGAPGQARFRLLWHELARGALGVLVLADARRLGDSFDVLDLVEDVGQRYAVAVNVFPDTPGHPPALLRKRLDLPPDTPLVMCDARDRASARGAVITLLTHIKELMSR